MLILKWMLHHWVFLTLFSILVIVSQIGIVMLDAWLEIKKAPTEPMSWCHKHGYFRKQHTLPLFPELGGTAENANFCPTCYYDMVWKNPDKRLNG